MIITSINDTKGNLYRLELKELPVYCYNTVILFRRTSNCKMIVADYFTSAFSDLKKKEEKIELIEMMCKEIPYLTFLIHTIDPDAAKFLCENFDIYYCNKVPIGYRNTYQYHLLMRNNHCANAKDYPIIPEKVKFKA